HDRYRRDVWNFPWRRLFLFLFEKAFRAEAGRCGAGCGPLSRGQALRYSPFPDAALSCAFRVVVLARSRHAEVRTRPREEGASSSRFTGGNHGDLAGGSVVFLWVSLRRAPLRAERKSSSSRIRKIHGAQLFRDCLAGRAVAFASGILLVWRRGHFFTRDASDRHLREILSCRAVVLFSFHFYREVHAGVPDFLLSRAAERRTSGEAISAGDAFPDHSDVIYLAVAMSSGIN